MGKVRQAQGTPVWASLLAGVLLIAGMSRRQISNRQTSKRTVGQRAGDQRTQRQNETASSAGRGRDADSPTEIPAQGWKDIAVRIYGGIGEDRVVAIAAGVTFFVLLAMFPGVAGLIALYGLFADPSTVAGHLGAMSGLLPEGGTQILSEQIERLTLQPPQKLGFAMIAGLAVSLWSANGGIKALFDALNVVYHEKEKRGFIRLNAQSLAFTAGALVFVIVALFVIAIIPAVLDALGISRAGELLIKIGRWPLLFLAASFFIALIYRFGPSRDKPKWRWITPGSLFAAAAWLAASLLFSWYAENFGSYNKTYGSLGAAVGFMTWLWISVMVILAGAKINAEMEHQTAQDTTVGRSRRLGDRQAHMADTVAEGRSPT
jgi:membrane protein